MCLRSHKVQVAVAKLFGYLLTGICLLVILLGEEIGSTRNARQTISLGTCKLVINKTCPDEDVKFFLYTNPFPNYSQPIKVGNTLAETNITDTWFNKSHPVKIIIHGYNSDMNLSALTEIRHQYLRKYNYNIFAVDWSVLCPGPCYPTAVHNTRHAGKCTAQLVSRLIDLGIKDIHVIGFSLGAHVTNYIANNLKPYKLPRISGLDPAMPGFTFVSKDNKLDSSDANFVDVIHTNAFIQGTIESSGHVDFYMNGGIVQPGCWAESRFFACNHHRAPLYFAESITTDKGFWGWPCSNYFMYLIGQCPPREPQIIAGDLVNSSARGMHLAITSSVSPFAIGKFTGPSIEIIKTIARQRKASLKRVQEMKHVNNDDYIYKDNLKDILNDNIFVKQV